MSDSLRSHGLQHARLPYPSVSWNLFKLMSIESVMPSNYLIVPFSRLQSFLASGSFQMSQLFASGGQTIGASASASILPMNIQDWFLLGLTGLISLLSKGLSRVFSNTTVQKHQFFSWTLVSCIADRRFTVWATREAHRGNPPGNQLCVYKSTVQKHQFFSAQFSFWSRSHIHTWLLEKP